MLSSCALFATDLKSGVMETNPQFVLTNLLSSIQLHVVELLNKPAPLISLNFTYQMISLRLIGIEPPISNTILDLFRRMICGKSILVEFGVYAGSIWFNTNGMEGTQLRYFQQVGRPSFWTDTDQATTGEQHHHLMGFRTLLSLLYLRKRRFKVFYDLYGPIIERGTRFIIRELFHQNEVVGNHLQFWNTQNVPTLFHSNSKNYRSYQAQALVNLGRTPIGSMQPVMRVIRY